MNARVATALLFGNPLYAVGLFRPGRRHVPAIRPHLPSHAAAGLCSRRRLANTLIPEHCFIFRIAQLFTMRF
jgi:hypothetical protein